VSYQHPELTEDVNWDLVWLKRQRDRVRDIEPINEDAAEQRRQYLERLDRLIAKEEAK
jgi:hypothetical protein